MSRKRRGYVLFAGNEGARTLSKIVPLLPFSGPKVGLLRQHRIPLSTPSRPNGRPLRGEATKVPLGVGANFRTRPIADTEALRHRSGMKKASILDPAAEGRLTRVRFSAAFMSDTKWRKLIESVRDADQGVSQMQLKFIDVSEPSKMRFPPSLACHHAYMDTIEFGPVELRSIEWLEFAGDWATHLDSIGQFPIDIRNGRTRIVGYGNGAL